MNIDELNIKISSNTKSAKSGIDNLTSALKVLSEIDLSNIQSLISGLEKISTALTGNKSSTSGANGITETVKETKKLKAVVSETSPKITEIKKTLNEMPSKSISRSLTENELKTIDDAVKRIEQGNKRISGTAPDTNDPSLPTGKKYMDYSTDESLKKLREELSLTDKDYEKAFKTGKVHKTADEWIEFKENISNVNSELEKTGNNGSSAVNKIKGSVTNTTPKIEELKEQLKELSAQGYTFGDKNFDKTYQELSKNISILKKYKSNLENANTSAKGMLSPLKKLNVLLKGLSKVGKSFGKSLLGGAKKAITNGIKPLSKGITQFKNMLKGMLIRSVLYTAMKAVREGFGSLAKEDGRFNKSMSHMYSALMTLKNAFVAAFAPIVETVEPYITTLLNMLTQVVTKVTQVLAALTGSSSATIAKKLTLDYAEAMDESSSSTDKATQSNKKFKKSLMGFDEINKLNGDDSSASDSSSEDNFTTQFTTGGANDFAKLIKESWENADFTNIGELISSKIVGIFQSIDWEKIQTITFKGGKSIATLINGLFSYSDEDGNTLSTSICSTIANIINTVFSYLDGFVNNLDWENIGSEFKNGIIAIFDGLDWETIKSSIVGLTTGFAEFINGLFDLNEQGKSELATSLSSFVTEAISLAFVSIDDFIGTVNWENIGISIAQFIQNIDWVRLFTDAFKLISSALIGLLDLLIGFIEGMDWGKAVKDLFAIVSSLFTSIDWTSITNKLSRILGDLVGAIVRVIVQYFIEKIRLIFNLGQIIYDFFEEHIEDAKASGGSVADGILQGIKDSLSSIGTWIKENIFNPFIEGFKKAFGIHSPSTVMAEQGGYIIDGLKNGIGNIWQKVREKFDAFKSKISTWFSEKISNFRKLGSDLISNIRDGIGDIWNKVRGKFTDFWQSMKDYLGSKVLKLSVEWDTSSVVGQALAKVGLQGLPKLSFYENGGFPNIGELFIANERGAEMVGSLNNRPAVANNQQIENALENAIYRGMMAAGNNGGNSINLNVTVPLDEAILGRAMVDYHNGYVKSTGGSPLLRGG